METKVMRFAAGHIYAMRSACDSDCWWYYEVISRTKQTVWLLEWRNGANYGRVFACRISKKLTELRDAECCKPLGTHSMSPILSADEELSQDVRQWYIYKEKYPDAIIMFSAGDYYNVFGDDAEVCAGVIGIEICDRHQGFDMVIFTKLDMDVVLPKMVGAGKRVAICEAEQPPQMMMKMSTRSKV